jgi:hypothetical protein
MFENDDAAGQLKTCRADHRQDKKQKDQRRAGTEREYRHGEDGSWERGQNSNVTEGMLRAVVK